MYIDSHYPFQMLPLAYDFDALCPTLSAETVSNHYLNHYQNYLNKLNAVLAKHPNYQTFSLDELLFNSNVLPAEDALEITYNAGGVYNHQIYFESMSPQKKGLVDCKLKEAIIDSFDSVENFLTEFVNAANRFNGSGYIFLVCNEHNVLSIFPVINQDTTVPFNLCPLMCIDLWEHAYYLDYGSDRSNYINNWLNLINWQKINDKYLECLKFIDTPE